MSLRYFRADPELLIKTDGSPVTVADRETERVIRDLLSRSYPRHAVFGEEFGWTPSDQPYTWIVDPIDGTKSYLAGAPTYGMLLALLYDGVPVLGIIDIPQVACSTKQGARKLMPVSSTSRRPSCMDWGSRRPRRWMDACFTKPSRMVRSTHRIRCQKSTRRASVPTNRCFIARGSANLATSMAAGGQHE